jgi:transcriptional regulator with XRE-family HTH domain
MARPIAEDFGRAFKHAYQAAGLTQVELARRLRARGWVKVDQPQISKWVRGVSVPPLEVLPDVDAACNRPKGYVLRVAGYVDDPPPSVGGRLEAELRALRDDLNRHRDLT